jgi:PAS domain S-box-containing protein
MPTDGGGKLSSSRCCFQDLQEHVGAAPSEEQLDQLNEMIARSQRSFKELIDSFDDAACAVSLDGTLRTVNKSVSELAGSSLHRDCRTEVLRLSGGTHARRCGSRTHAFSGKTALGRHGARASSRTTPGHSIFDCVLNAIVKSGEVVGLSVLGRDVTGQHEKELRFTELFETLQEGAYFSTPEGRLLDANPALVNILGYATKDELLALNPKELNLDPKKSLCLAELLTIAAACAREKLRCVRKMGGQRGVSGIVSRRLGCRGQVDSLPGHVDRRHGEAQAGAATAATGRISAADCWKAFPILLSWSIWRSEYTFVSSRVRDLLGLPSLRI